MTWVKLDDNFPTNPKVLAAGDMAAWLYVCGLCYSGNALSDGFIPTAVLGRLTGLPKPLELASRLVDVGLWHRVADGFQVHDYDKRQRSKAKVEAQREAAKVRANKRRSSQEVRANDARAYGCTDGELRVPDTDKRTSAVDNLLADFQDFGPEVARLKQEVAL